MSCKWCFTCMNNPLVLHSHMPYLSSSPIQHDGIRSLDDKLSWKNPYGSWSSKWCCWIVSGRIRLSNVLRICSENQLLFPVCFFASDRVGRRLLKNASNTRYYNPLGESYGILRFSCLNILIFWSLKFVIRVTRILNPIKPVFIFGLSIFF